MRPAILHLWLLALCVTLVRAAAPSEHGRPLVTSYRAIETGIENYSWTAVQDSDGTLYVGGDALFAFDGERWRSFPIDGGYALRGLAFSPDHRRIWTAASGQLGYYLRDGATWHFHSLLASVPSEHRHLGEVWSVRSEGDGAVFFTEDKVMRWDGHAFTVWVFPGTKRLVSLQAPDGTIYFTHRTTGGYRLDPAGPTLVIPASAYGGIPLVWIEPLGDGAWRFISDQGIYTWENGLSHPTSDAACAAVDGSSPVNCRRLRDGRLILATYRKGLIILDRDAAVVDQIIDRTTGLPSNGLQDAFQDRDGSIWVFSDTGLASIAVESSSTFFDPNLGLPAQPVHNLARYESRLYTGTADGIFSLDSDGRFHPAIGPADSTNRMLVTPVGLLASDNYGVFRVGSGASDYIYPALVTAYGLALSRSTPGSIYFCDGGNVWLLRLADHNLRQIVKNCPDLALTLAEDARGHLWLATFNYGLFEAIPDPAGPVTPKLVDSGPAAGDAATVRSTTEGGILVCNRHRAAFLAPHRATFEPVAGYPDHGEPAVSRFTADDRAWTFQPSQGNAPGVVGRVAISPTGAVWQPHHIDGLDRAGAPRSVLAEPAADGTTVLWIGGTQGLLRSVVSAAPSAPAPRAPILTTLARVAGESTPHPITATLPYATESIRFEFAAPQFEDRPQLRLETRIEGIDSDWVPAGTDSARELTAVRDGTYTFQVRAVAETGAVSPVTTFPFAIAPPWWRTTPALVAGLLLLAATGYGAYRLRVRAFARRNAELEAKVAERTAELALANAAKTQFVAAMSHDIRNPLNGIVGLTLDLESTLLDPDQREAVAALRSCSTYLSTLVEDVLDFASIEAGRVELHSETCEPLQLLRAVAAALLPQARRQNASFSVEFSPDLPSAFVADGGRLQQILVNYAANALKYAGGTITLSAHLPADTAGEIEFAVTDHGPGFDAEQAARLFSSFSRLEGARRAGIPGTGLGLASCRRLADLMGGSVGVDSAPGQGARFHLRLPLTPCTAPAPAAPDENPTPFSAGRALIVEDTDYNARAASAVLARLGFTAVHAPDGATALRLFAEGGFELVLLDRNLPDLDGTEIARRMRAAEPVGAHTLLVAVTAWCTAADRALCLEAGMDAFAGKPLTPEKLKPILAAAGRSFAAASPVQLRPDLSRGPETLDLALLRYLADEATGGLETQLDRFLDELARTETRLVANREADDLPALAETAHFAISLARMVSSSALTDAATRLETAVRRADTAAIRPAFDALLAEFDSLRARVQTLRSSPATV